VILKSYIVEANIKQLDNYNCTLFYGENIGIQEDVREKLKKENKDSECINLFQDEIIKNNQTLYSHIDNTSLFSAKKSIFILEASDKILEVIKNIGEKNLDVKIFIFSNMLDKKSKLRSYFEKEKKMAVIACYQDNERTLSNYILTKLNKQSGLNQEILNIIISNSHMDRRIIKSETEKISIFFQGKVIEKNTLLELLNIKNNTNFDKIRDAIFLGDKIKTNTLLAEIQFLQEDNFYYINKINDRTKKLIEIININMNTNDIELAMESLKPKIFWKDKPAYLHQLKKWSLEELLKVLEVVSKTEILMKKNSNINNDVLVKSLLIGICSKTFNYS